MRKETKTPLIIIAVLSVAIPAVVAILLLIPQTGKLGEFDVSFIPHLNGVLNSLTAISLVVGYYFIKQKNEAMHRNCMFAAFFLSSIFLVGYVVYHYQAPSTAFGGEGAVRYFYFFLLITHILLSMVIVPLVLFTIYFAVTRQLGRHRAIVRFTLPIWLYVAISGVTVYLMISPYYV